MCTGLGMCGLGEIGLPGGGAGGDAGRGGIVCIGLWIVSGVGVGLW